MVYYCTIQTGVASVLNYKVRLNSLSDCPECHLKAFNGRNSKSCHTKKLYYFVCFKEVLG